LDGIEIQKSERIAAMQQYTELRQKYVEMGYGETTIDGEAQGPQVNFDEEEAEVTDKER
jgi:hypothetical protein